MHKTSDTVIKELELGYVPVELTYTLEKTEEIDWTALYYDEWRDLSFWINKQEPGLLEQWPCLYSWVEQIWKENENKTPLQEIEERQATKNCEKKSDIIIYTNDSEELCKSNN